MKECLAYIRVSTTKQGERGVSLQEQRDAINRYADRNGLSITAWFEEQQTAAKRGRPQFMKMLQLLKKGHARGVIIHKIDRSARNLRDWADLGELIDSGVEVHFANESLDLRSRGGRLSADIQAVVAADFIRNLREETRKGFYGRLKQGFYPLPAPLGYLDRGAGKPKVVDSTREPLILKTFELYSTGTIGIDVLRATMTKLGLRNRRGRPLTRNGISTILNNPFYAGLIRIRKTGETFPGAHKAIVSTALFAKVQSVLHGKTQRRDHRHFFLFRRLLACLRCKYTLIGELQKGHVYYRCQTAGCPTTTVREEAVEAQVESALSGLTLSQEEVKYVKSKLADLEQAWSHERDSIKKSLQLAIAQESSRIERLTDAYLDGAIDRDVFETRKATLLLKKRGVEERLADVETGTEGVQRSAAEFLEFLEMPLLQYKMALPEGKREMVKKITSNRTIDGRTPYFKLSQPYLFVANRYHVLYGDPYRAEPRTEGTLSASASTKQMEDIWDKLLPSIIEWFMLNGK